MNHRKSLLSKPCNIFNVTYKCIFYLTFYCVGYKEDTNDRNRPNLRVMSPASSTSQRSHQSPMSLGKLQVCVIKGFK
jgi:hypothetical protein